MNNNSVSTSQYQSDGSEQVQGIIFQSLDLEFLKIIELSMSQCKSQQRVDQHQERVNDIVNKISQLIDIAPIDISGAYYLLLQLQSQLKMEQSAQIQTELLYTIVLNFRDLMVQNYDFQKLVQFQLLTYEAEIILRKVNSKHVSVDILEEIMINLTNQVVPMSRDFLIENAIATDLWFTAVKKQRFQLAYDEELMKLMLDFIDYPYAFKVFTGQENMPFKQDIFNKAWEKMQEDEVLIFIIDEIFKKGQYFEAFLQSGIFDPFKLFITKTLSIEIKKVKVINIQYILQCLSCVFIEDDLLSDIKQIYESRILDYIADIPINLINQKSLLQIDTIINRIDNNKNYDLNFIILSFTWYQKLNKVLLLQKINKKIAEMNIFRLNQLCNASLCLQASQVVNAIISEYKESTKSKSIFQVFMNFFQ